MFFLLKFVLFCQFTFIFIFPFFFQQITDDAASYARKGPSLPAEHARLHVDFARARILSFCAYGDLVGRLGAVARGPCPVRTVVVVRVRQNQVVGVAMGEKRFDVVENSEE